MFVLQDIKQAIVHWEKPVHCKNILKSFIQMFEILFIKTFTGSNKVPMLCTTYLLSSIERSSIIGNVTKSQTKARAS